MKLSVIDTENVLDIATNYVNNVMDTGNVFDIATKSANNFNQSFMIFVSDNDFLKFETSVKETISTLEQCYEIIKTSCKDYNNAHKVISDRDLQNLLDQERVAMKIRGHIRYIQAKIEEGRSSNFSQDDHCTNVSPTTVTFQACGTPARSNGGESKSNDTSPQFSDITGDISESSLHFSIFSGSGNTSNLNEEVTKNVDVDSSAWTRLSKLF